MQRHPKGRVRLFGRTQRMLRRRLPIHDAKISVAVDGPIVTLAGRVSSYAEKMDADRAVQRVRGVRAIADEIVVGMPTVIADEEIARHALAVLDWDTHIPRRAVQVTVQNGGVTLSGRVGAEAQRGAAEDHVRKIPGVTWVVNRLTVEGSTASLQGASI